MITIAAIIGTLALTLTTLVTGIRRTRRNQATAEASPVLVRYGLDTYGRVWSVRALDTTSVRLYRGAHVHVDACGERTFNLLSTRYGISWER